MVILMDVTPVEFGQLDLVVLLTTRNVSYLSTTPGHIVEPNGLWSVACAIAGDLLLTKDGATIRIPISDVQMYMKHELFSLDTQIGSVLNGRQREDEGKREEHKE